jgi:putative transposase
MSLGRQDQRNGLWKPCSGLKGNWGAYVVLRNHFHLAVRTPHPNLSAGMQWLQATFATRFNRMRSERGHLFQGRFKALLLENEGVWARVADYVHLNPLRVGVVESEHLVKFR